MENVVIDKLAVTWEEVKIKLGSEFRYKYKVLNHGSYLSVSKVLYVDGVYKQDSLVHIPLELMDGIKALEPM